MYIWNLTVFSVLLARRDLEVSYQSVGKSQLPATSFPPTGSMGSWDTLARVVGTIVIPIIAWSRKSTRGLRWSSVVGVGMEVSIGF